MTPQLAGYCCPAPALQFDWVLGTELENTDNRVVILTNMRCLNCGTEYSFKGTAVLMPGNERAIVLDVDVPKQVLQ